MNVVSPSNSSLLVKIILDLLLWVWLDWVLGSTIGPAIGGIVAEILNFLDKGAISFSSDVVEEEINFLPLPLIGLVFWLWKVRAGGFEIVSLILSYGEGGCNLEEVVVSFFLKFARETLVRKSSSISIACFSIEVGRPTIHLNKHIYIY